MIRNQLPQVPLEHGNGSRLGSYWKLEKLARSEGSNQASLSILLLVDALIPQPFLFVRTVREDGSLIHRSVEAHHANQPVRCAALKPREIHRRTEGAESRRGEATQKEATLSPRAGPGGGDNLQHPPRDATSEPWHSSIVPQ